MNTAQYDPSEWFENTNTLYNNHFRFALEGLPDLTFYVQSVAVPNVASSHVEMPTPFTRIATPGDALKYASLEVSYLIDAELKNYFSLFCWLKGYGFPHSYEEVLAFKEARMRQLPMPRPSIADMFKTTAVLSVLQPDTERILAEFQFIDVFPVSLGELRFETTSGDANQLTSTATFAYTAFDVVLHSS